MESQRIYLTSACASAKRLRKSLSLSEKLDAIREVDKKEKSKTAIAKQFHIPVSTLSTYLKNRKGIENSQVHGFNVQTRQRLRVAKYPNVEKELYEWCIHKSVKEVAISGLLVKQKADAIALQLGITDFKCSNGWLHRFKERHSIKSLRVRKRQSTSSTVAAEGESETDEEYLDGEMLDSIKAEQLIYSPSDPSTSIEFSFVDASDPKVIYTEPVPQSAAPLSPPGNVAETHFARFVCSSLVSIKSPSLRRLAMKRINDVLYEIQEMDDRT